MEFVVIFASEMPQKLGCGIDKKKSGGKQPDLDIVNKVKRRA